MLARETAYVSSQCADALTSAIFGEDVSASFSDSLGLAAQRFTFTLRVCQARLGAPTVSYFPVAPRTRFGRQALRAICDP